MSPIAVIAGAGDFPILLAKAARSHGHQVFGFGVVGFASSDLASNVDRMFWLELGQFGRLIEMMHEQGVKSVTMAGRVPHTSILQYRHFDLRALKLLAKALNRRADALLGALTAELEHEGFRVLDTTLFLRSLLAGSGLLTTRRPLDSREAEDAVFGFPIAKVVAGQDIGQTIIVKEKMVIAVEGAEGTDECIRRAGQIGGDGCVVIKVSKPQQDRRFDVPVVGMGTIESMKAAHCSALILSAGETLILNPADVIAAAEEYGVGILARS